MRKEKILGFVVESANFFSTLDEYNEDLTDRESKQALVDRYQIDSTKGGLFARIEVEEGGCTTLVNLYRNMISPEDILKPKPNKGDMVKATGVIIGHEQGNNIIEVLESDFYIVKSAKSAKKPDALSIKEEVEHYSKEDPIS